MEVLNRIEDVRNRVKATKDTGGTVGLVPTMGALHEGHLSLIRRAKEECDLVVVSIFVNPTQFGPNEDFSRYPRDFSGDESKCQRVGCDIIFAPDTDDVYPEGFSTYVDVEGVTDLWEGAARPGHFRGVATVVSKLFNMVQPSSAYFGMKDYQQLQVIKKMVRDLNMDVNVVPCPTVRELDGLAMSSRNAYLSPEERKAATVLFKSLELARDRIEGGETNAAELVGAIKGLIKSEPLADIDYVAIADPTTLLPVEKIEDDIVVMLAVRVGKTRLIDNTLVDAGDKTIGARR